jgi:hypothetical protein
LNLTDDRSVGWKYVGTAAAKAGPYILGVTS